MFSFSRTVSKQRFAPLLLLLSLAFASLTPVITMGVHAAPDSQQKADLEKAVEKAVTKLKNSPPKHGLYVDAKRIDDSDTWAFGSVAILTPAKHDAKDEKESREHDVLPEGFLWIAKRTAKGWEAALDFTPTFYDYAKAAPLTVVDQVEKDIFATSSDDTVSAAGDTAGNFSLPWFAGQSWNLRGGPHGWGGTARPWSALDLNPADGSQAPVHAAREGKVYRMCTNSSGAKTTWLQVRHTDGWSTDYYHLSSFAPGTSDGTEVVRGQWLGHSGRTVDCGGSASGNHVHFNIRLNGTHQEWNNREAGGWTMYVGSSAYGGRAERSYVGGNTVVNAGSSMYNIGVQYTAYVEGIGWQAGQSNDAVAGTVGQSRRLEAIQISLQKPAGTPSNVGICYQVHMEAYGWMGVACNGQTAGLPGQNLRMEAIKVWLTDAPNRAGVCYSAHVQAIGWQPYSCDSAQGGTTGQSLRIEAIKLRISP